MIARRNGSRTSCVQMTMPRTTTPLTARKMTRARVQPTVLAGIGLSVIIARHLRRSGVRRDPALMLPDRAFAPLELVHGPPYSPPRGLELTEPGLTWSRRRR